MPSAQVTRSSKIFLSGQLVARAHARKRRRRRGCLARMRARVAALGGIRGAVLGGFNEHSAEVHCFVERAAAAGAAKVAATAGLDFDDARAALRKRFRQKLARRTRHDGGESSDGVPDGDDERHHERSARRGDGSEGGSSSDGQSEGRQQKRKPEPRTTRRRTRRRRRSSTSDDGGQRQRMRGAGKGNNTDR